MKSPVRYALGAAIAIIFALAPTIAFSAANGGFDNDYPTVARADYVFGCMAVNGQDRNVLQQCSCSIDLIASILPYEKYVEAETVLQMRQASGENVAFFKSSPVMQALVDDMRRAQAEAELRCF